MGVMIVSLIKTIKSSNRKEDSYCKTLPTFNFMCVIMILVTFLVYNILLANEYTVIGYFTSLSNMLMHVILPIMFILNWVLFYEHNTLKWYHPLLCIIMPLIYVIFIIIRALILNGSTNSTLYPYFFLDINNLGWSGFFIWILILLVVFVLIGYGLFALDKYVFTKKDKKVVKKNESI